MAAEPSGIPLELRKPPEELGNSSRQKLLVLQTIERVRALQPISEAALMAELVIGEPYMSQHKSQETVLGLMAAGRLKYNGENLLCLTE